MLKSKCLVVVLLGLLWLPFLVRGAAEDEIYQVIPFAWDSEKQTLSAFGLGSGVSLHGMGLVTNRHVILHPTTKKPADLVLLCQGNRRRSHTAECEVEGAVTAYHETLDVALIQPLDGKPLVPASSLDYPRQTIGTKVRLYGFPYSENTGDFGDTRTFKALGAGEENPEIDFEALGDRITITRGEIIQMYQDNLGQKAYYGTSAKGDHGISGGGAFNAHGRYIGIPTFKDSQNQIIVLAFSEIYDWLEAKKEIDPQVTSEVLDFYDTYVRKGNTRMSRLERRKTILRMQEGAGPQENTTSRLKARLTLWNRQRRGSPPSEEAFDSASEPSGLSLKERLKLWRSRR